MLLLLLLGCSCCVFALVISAAPGGAEARRLTCTLGHRVPAPIRRAILRRFVELRHAPAGPTRSPKFVVRCGPVVTVLMSIEPPPTRLRRCGDPDQPNLCLPYQDDSVWRRRGTRRWKLRGGFLACQDFPRSERARFFAAGVCAELGP